MWSKDKFAKLSNTPDVYRFLICFIPLSYQIKKDESKRDGGNKWLLIRGHKEKAETNLKHLLNSNQIFSALRTAWLLVYRDGFKGKEKNIRLDIEDPKQDDVSNLHQWKLDDCSQ